MKYLLLIITVISLTSCSTVATQSEDGLTMKIKGQGAAKFENGASIEGGTWMPKFPSIAVDK